MCAFTATSAQSGANGLGARKRQQLPCHGNESISGVKGLSYQVNIGCWLQVEFRLQGLKAYCLSRYIPLG
jgi:hypothetical protein